MVQNDGEFSDQFPVINGAKQGFILASTLFSLMFSAMLTDAFQDGDNAIPTRHCFDGKLFNLRRLQAKSKVQTEVLDEFFFADDMAKGGSNRRENLIHVSVMIFISIKSNEVLYQPAPGTLQAAYHHSERSKIASGRHVQLPWKHIV